MQSGSRPCRRSAPTRVDRSRTRGPRRRRERCCASYGEPWSSLRRAACLLGSAREGQRVRSHGTGCGNMRLAAAVTRFLFFLVVLAFVSMALLRGNGLPIAPHAIPATGGDRFLAQVLGTLWWFSAAATVTLLVRLMAVFIARVPTKHRRRVFFLGDVTAIVSFLIAAIALSAFVFELPVTTLFATSSIIAVVLGFALQNTLADLLSGVSISIEQPFRIGDRIAVDDRTGGRVVEVNWRAARLLTSSGDLIVVPNS